MRCMRMRMRLFELCLQRDQTRHARRREASNSNSNAALEVVLLGPEASGPSSSGMSATAAAGGPASLRLPDELDAQQVCERFKLSDKQLSELHARRLSWHESRIYGASERVKLYKVGASPWRQGFEA